MSGLSAVLDPIQDHVTRAFASGKEHSTTSLGLVSEANAAFVLRATRHSIAGHERVMQSSDIRHVRASHGDPSKEAARGQIAITKSDFTRVPAIVEAALSVRLIGTIGSRKPLRLEYVARIEDHEYRYVEEIRSGRVVALKAMRKTAL